MITDFNFWKALIILTQLSVTRILQILAQLNDFKNPLCVIFLYWPYMLTKVEGNSIIKRET